MHVEPVTSGNVYAHACADDSMQIYVRVMTDHSKNGLLSYPFPLRPLHTCSALFRAMKLQSDNERLIPTVESNLSDHSVVQTSHIAREKVPLTSRPFRDLRTANFHLYQAYSNRLYTRVASKCAFISWYSTPGAISKRRKEFTCLIGHYERVPTKPSPVLSCSIIDYTTRQ